MKNEIIYVVLTYALLNTIFLSFTFNNKTPKEELLSDKIAVIEATKVGDEVIWEFNVNKDFYENDCAFSISLMKATKEFCEK